MGVSYLYKIILFQFFTCSSSSIVVLLGKAALGRKKLCCSSYNQSTGKRRLCIVAKLIKVEQHLKFSYSWL